MEKLFLIHLMFLIFQTVNGSYSKWTCWTHCSVTCGSGSQERRRTCQNPPLAKIGPDCSKSTSESKTCTLTACPINGNYGKWTAWSSCHGNCKGGVQVRRRSCNSPAPSNNGLDCSGKSSEKRRCKLLGCPIRGKWGSWTGWSRCSVSCGIGSRMRTRSCDNPAPANNGPECSGPGSESRKCAPKPCPINGDWGEWKEWSSCFGGCKNGRQRRRRTCDSPAPANNGRDCSGTGSQIRRCKPLRCPISGNWGSWKDWTMCSKTCGGGIQERSRSCDNPAPANNGPDCSGSDTESRQCASNPCPIAGNWGSWKDWTMCPNTCGGGIQVRSRSCDNPAPANNGQGCIGSDTESRQCASNPCPIAGNWGSWKDWTMCPNTCGGGIQVRSRSCDNPAPANNGQGCIGSDTESRQCASNPCPIAGNWGSWKEWTMCSASCGGGSQNRIRLCDNPAPANNGPECSDSDTESRQCASTLCPINGNWGRWGQWNLCSGTCKSASRLRRRSCNKPAPANDGLTCIGSGTERSTCILFWCR
ncbi:Hemicentin-1,Coadhesin,Adhesion G protein-coupled receptor B3,Adhesion G protein-coupled receptor B2,Thrombospondin-1,Mucin-like protein [Mytilus edulis]|uniref:Hemicentin-1,Coadhesin,Adhesion G protein-coupled receptor B3,Adhesion G protein-coupled receptor B2,Thrombospondin-1,Mucin-like protein n=1 Tax=Mytilus edulis TaxID=6550 RepID=A0A8S3R325_MYTED|nr:Hemicentin-1,Coadhesin,Adhesion G protein-coupled receptor B3,Adhesion G protein-coupled receptor B2,Thrombospondin-1,Mucin-like protein [Mytilus edulis]